MSGLQPGRHMALERVIEVPAVIVVFIMMGHVTANALARSLFDNPLPNTLEIVQYWYLPIVALLGFVAAQARGQHIAADLIYQHLPHRARPYVLAALLLTSAATCVGFAWFSWPEALQALETRRTGGVSAVPVWPVYFLVPAVFSVLSLQFFTEAWRVARGRGPAGAGAADDPSLQDDFETTKKADR